MLSLLPEIYYLLKSGDQNSARSLLRANLWSTSFKNEDKDFSYEEDDASFFANNKYDIGLLVKQEFFYNISQKIEEFDLDFLRDLIIEHNLVNLKDDKSRTLLINAVVKRDYKLAEELLELGADPNIEDYRGDTPLTKHNYKEDFSFFLKLLDHGADILPSTKKLKSGIYSELINRDKYLLSKYSKDTLKERFGWTDLHIAVYFDDRELFDILINEKVDLEAKDNYGYTPALLAVLFNRSEYYISMAKNGLDQSARYENIGGYLNAACLFNSLEIAEYFLSNYEGVKSLLENSAVEDPLHAAASSSSPEMIDLLVSFGFDVNMQDSKAKKPLYYAIFNNNTETFKKLLDLGAEITKADEKPLIKDVIKIFNYSALEELIKLGIKIEKENIQPQSYEFGNTEQEKIFKTFTALADYTLREDSEFSISDLINIGNYSFIDKSSAELVEFCLKNERKELVLKIIDILLDNFFSYESYRTHFLIKNDLFGLGNEEVNNYIVKKIFYTDGVPSAQKIYFAYYLLMNQRYDILSDAFDSISDSDSKQTFLNDCLFGAVITKSAKNIEFLLSKGAISVNYSKVFKKNRFSIPKDPRDILLEKYELFYKTFSETMEDPEISYLSDVNILHVAALYSSEEVIACLVSNGADISEKCIDHYYHAKKNPMEISIEYNYSEGLENLLLPTLSDKEKLSILLNTLERLSNLYIFEFIYINIKKIESSIIKLSDTSIFSGDEKSSEKIEFLKTLHEFDLKLYKLFFNIIDNSSGIKSDEIKELILNTSTYIIQPEIHYFLLEKYNKKSGDKFNLEFTKSLYEEARFIFCFEEINKVQFFFGLNFSDNAIEYFNNLKCESNELRFKILYHCYKGNIEVLKSLRYDYFDENHIKTAISGGNFKLAKYIFDQTPLEKSAFDHIVLSTSFYSKNENIILSAIENVDYFEGAENLFGVLFMLWKEKGEYEEPEVASASSAAALSSKTSGFEMRGVFDFSVMLNFAAKFNMHKTVKWLLEAGANTEKSGDMRKTPLILASESGNSEIIKTLLDNGANTEATDLYGNNYLDLLLANAKNINNIKPLQAEEVATAAAANIVAAEADNADKIAYAAAGTPDIHQDELIHAILGE
jgi:ankyrin repeat protein